MSTDFSAAPQALGYLYQIRYALYLILDRPEETELSIESLDDLVFEHGETGRESMQLKHRARQAVLTDSSSDLWKTLRIWSEMLQVEEKPHTGIVLTLITTATAPEDSISAFLRPDDRRDPARACQEMINVAKTSKNKELSKAFEAFLSLSSQERSELVDAIQVLDGSPNIVDTEIKIKQKIQGAVRREHRDSLYQRLEGWWFDKAIRHLSGESPHPTIGFEVYDKISAIAEQFRPNALPIDFFDKNPPTPPDPEGDNRCFVIQLREIALASRRIEKAILDYYRAFQQRSLWAREGLIIGEDLEQYERKLIDEWERYFLLLQNDDLVDQADEQELKKFGRQVYNWVDQIADIRIRSAVTEEYVMRGSYHMLADQNPPRVWWHPKFVERLEELLPI